MKPPPPLDGIVDIQGGAYIPEPGYAEARGPLAALTSAPAEGGQVTWSFTVGSDAFSVRLPPAIAFPAAEGDVVEAYARVTGGGPNAFGNLRMRDDKGGLLLAVLWLPDDWSADYATPVKTRRGHTYDEVEYRVRVTAPGGDTAELGNAWRRVTLAGATFLGQGSAAKRYLHGDAPADYVGSWVDVTLVRVR